MFSTVIIDLGKVFVGLQDYMIPVNETTESLELHLELNTASNMYWMLISTFEIAIETNRKNGMGRVRCLAIFDHGLLPGTCNISATDGLSAAACITSPDAHCPVPD